MPEYHVTLNEIEARTYKVEADDADDAIQVAKSLQDPRAHLVDVEWLDYWGDANEDDVVKVSNEVIHSPSGWHFRESQENGDQVDCQECGNTLNDDHPIVNDNEGYAYHEDCLQPSN